MCFNSSGSHTHEIKTHLPLFFTRSSWKSAFVDEVSVLNKVSIFLSIPFTNYSTSSEVPQNHIYPHFTLKLFAGIVTFSTHKIRRSLVSCPRRLLVRVLYGHRKDVRSIPAGEPIVDDAFLNCSGLELGHVCDFQSIYPVCNFAVLSLASMQAASSFYCKFTVPVNLQHFC